MEASIVYVRSKCKRCTADRLLMPQVPTDMFVDACKAVVKANEGMFHHMVQELRVALRLC